MSKFDKIFEAREAEAADAEVITVKKPTVSKSDEKRKKIPRSNGSVSVEPESGIELTKQINPKRGRPTAKRSDPDFVGLTTYVRRDTHTRAKIALLQEGKGRELSELVEDLIYNWLSKK